MPLHQCHDDQPSASNSRRGALVLALILVLLLAGAGGLAGYVWLTPQPLRIGNYALVGPGYRRPTYSGSYANIIDVPSDAISVRRSHLMLSGSAGSDRIDVAEVLWQWASVRWVWILKTR